MSRFLWGLCWGLLLFAAPPLAAGELVRLVTWNLQWYPGGRPSASAEACASQVAVVQGELARLHPDILIVQEVRDQAAAETLAAAVPGLRVQIVSRFKSTFDGSLVEQQIAILSRFEATAVWSAPWNRGWAGAPRGYAFASLRIGTRLVSVYGVHLKSNLGGAIESVNKREDAMAQLLDHARLQGAVAGERALIIAGDLNTSPEQMRVLGERTFDLLHDARMFWTFEGVPMGSRVTCPAKGSLPPANFDHILVRGLGRPVARVAADARGSDHLPVWIEIVL